ncbi:MAG TPA: murein L,D-transpeptidase catalytic domain family protein [Longimicrobium sp.]|jgi:hypothetical protein|uniref:murein L,D-transpeptidase catalytic domain-containing protein n=1 Tax=Longimicrobium sp. TaxID=2029185 RepID=UPI002ED8D93C
MRFDLLMAIAAALHLGDAPAVPHTAVTASPRLAESATTDTIPGSARRALQAARAVLGGFGIENASANARTSAALNALRHRVSRSSDPDALRMAFRAYYNYRAAHPENVRKPYLYFVDYGLDSRTPRGYVFDMERLRVVDGPFAVAHGSGSEPQRTGVPRRFSNQFGSHATSLGLFLAQETYNFVGHDSGRPYRSIGLRLTGLSGVFNNTARQRGVVMHGAPYVTRLGAGRSQGCPAVEQSRAYWLIPELANGSLVFLFSPLDRDWMRSDPWGAGGRG